MRFPVVREPVQGLRTNSGSLAIFTAIRRASSLLSNWAAERRPGERDAVGRVSPADDSGGALAGCTPGVASTKPLQTHSGVGRTTQDISVAGP
jgi:hypothetical protein